MSACRRADRGSTPWFTLFAVTASTYDRSSSSRSISIFRPRASVRHKLTTFGRSGIGVSIGFEHEANRRDDAGPLLLFSNQLLTSRRREAVSLDAAPGLGDRPLTGDEPFLFEPVQRRKQRSGLDVEGAPGDLLDALGNADAVARLELERPQDQQAESALEDFGRLRHGVGLNIDNLYQA